MSDISCLDCEGTSISLYADDPINPIHYHLRCEDCKNHTNIYDSITKAYDEWYGKYWSMLHYQHPDLAQHIHKIRGYS